MEYVLLVFFIAQTIVVFSVLTNLRYRLLFVEGELHNYRKQQQRKGVTKNE